MFDKTVVAVCIVICVVVGAWTWWWENGSVKKDDKKDDNQADRKCKNDIEDKRVKNDTGQLERKTKI